jgi:hypothetical protein
MHSCKRVNFQQELPNLLMMAISFETYSAPVTLRNNLKIVNTKICNVQDCSTNTNEEKCIRDVGWKVTTKTMTWMDE